MAKHGTCPHCGSGVVLKAEWAGKQIRCRKCGGVMTIPRRRRAWKGGVALLCVIAAVGAAVWLVRLPTKDAGGRPDEAAAPAPVTDARGQPAPAPVAWAFDYDPDGRLTRVVDPGGKETRFRRETDPHGRLSRQVTELADGSKVVIDFDEHGRRKAMTDPAGTAHYERDGFGRTTAVRRAGAPALEFAHDTSDRVTALTAGGMTVRYVRDFLGRLERMETPVGAVTYAYPAEGQTVRTLPNGVRTVWQHGPDGRLGSLEHAGPDRLVLVRFRYSYRPDGLISEVKEWSPRGERAIAYRYDREARLSTAEETGPDGTKTRREYAYDPYGNRTEITTDGRKTMSRFDWAGRLVEHDGRPCRHDPSGNLMEYSRPDGEVKLTYTATNQLATAQTPRGNVLYEYDGEGNLIGRTIDGRKTVFVPDPTADVWRPLLAVEAGGRQAFLLWDGDTPLGMVEGGTARFFLHDQLGTVRCAADRQGKAAGWFDCGPFGEPGGAPSADGLRPGFAGLFYDPVAAVYLTRARGYDPALGRFLQTDPQHRMPTGSQKDLSVYAYCGGDPINCADRTGAAPDDDARRLLRYAETFLGTPYRQMDCSAFVRQVIRSTEPKFPELNAAGIRNSGLFPPTTAPRAGDLVYWPPPPRSQHGHVGFVVDPRRGVFIGSQSSTGVAERNYLTDPYWSRRAGLTFLRRNPDTHVPQPGNTLPFPSRLAGSPGRRENFPLLPPPGGGGALSPGKVGGVALRGAGDALKDLGPLRGVALDANGRLVLLGQDKGDLELPPLRLDDVVTVFRNVYRHGEAPFVSIDPDPDRPEGDVMHVRHGPAIDASYVAWVLFEADRVIKCYSVGFDNETGEPLASRIDGYKDSNLFAVPVKAGATEPLWERFWIVPARVARKQDRAGKLTLLDVGLELKTQAMVLRKGKLEAAPGGRSSEAAKKFTTWFTKHYPDLEKEAMSTPPADNGLTKPVPIFAELRRVALVVAVAEALRDQGVPLPGWMKQYDVKPFPVPATTRGRTFKVPGRGAIYGGVNLSPEKSAVQTVTAPEAQDLAAILERTAPPPLLQPVRVGDGPTACQAVALPGNDTLALGGNSLEETDLVVPVRGEVELSLSRHFHSFFRPGGALGSAWTLDLPRLERLQRAEIVGDKKTLHTFYQLTSPLQSVSAVFRRPGEIPQIKGEVLLADGSPDLLALARVQDDELGSVLLVLFKDGRRWYFDDTGELIARKEPPLTTRYVRDTAGRLTQVVATSGGGRAAITLDYDDRGRLRTARADNGAEVAYSYDGDGLLTRARGPAGEVTYEYKDGLVSAVRRGGQPAREFVHDAGGRLLKERVGGGPGVAYRTEAGPAGARAVLDGLGGQEVETIEYDRSYRPLRRSLADGTRQQWQYQDDGAVAATTTLPDGRRYTATRSADGRREALRLPEGGELAVQRDEWGRVTAVLEGDRPALRQEWHPNGLLRRVVRENVAVEPTYGKDGAVRGVALSPPDAGPAGRRWVELTLDDRGRPARVTDATGAETAVTYDETGEPRELITGPNKVTIQRGPQGRVRALRTSWGYRQENAFAEAGGLLRTTFTAGTSTAVVDYDDGRPAKVCDFEGGVTEFTWHDEGPTKDRPKSVRTPGGLGLGYRYDAEGRLVEVRCGESQRWQYRYDDKGRLAGLALLPAGP